MTLKTTYGSGYLYWFHWWGYNDQSAHFNKNLVFTGNLIFPPTDSNVINTPTSYVSQYMCIESSVSVFAIRNISRAQSERVLLPTQQSPHRFSHRLSFAVQFFRGSEEDETLCCLDSGLVSDNRATEASTGCRSSTTRRIKTQATSEVLLCHPACEPLERKRKSLHVCEDIIQSTHKTLSHSFRRQKAIQV